MSAQVPGPAPQTDAELERRLSEAEAEIAELRRGLAEGLARETAKGEILRVIASSPTDLQPVLNAVVENAARLCDTHDAVIFRVDGDTLRRVAEYGPLQGASVAERLPLIRTVPASRATIDRQTIHIHDVQAMLDSEYPDARVLQQRVGTRSLLATPLLREGIAMGAILIRRLHVRPFTDAQIQLLETFADQAVIAIENTRLFQELTESLERQTATAEILRVIANSPTGIEPTFEAIAAAATNLCEADLSGLFRFDGELIHFVAQHGRTQEEIDAARRAFPQPPSHRSVTARAIMAASVAHIPDISEDPEVEESLRIFRTVLSVPIMREGRSIGAITVARRVVKPFTDQQIKLLETFADQAAIAIENTRLFRELADLNRTLEARVNQQVEELERVGRLRRYLSPQLADVIVSSGDESILDSHRRQITVVFCDLRGFTAFAEVAEPEEVMAALAEYHAAVGELIDEYGGTIEHFAGDGVMVFFNDPVPQPDHAERAVRMACAMRERVDGLARRWRRQGYELGFGVGIAVGYATLGRIGFEGRFDYAVIGTVSNLAARLCGEAASRQILISGRLLGEVEDLVEVENLGELTLKGFHRPMEAFNVVGLRAAGSAPPDQGAGQTVEDG